jgi:hypothetical protein
MTFFEMLTQLACSLFFWPATFHCLGLDRPDAYVQQAYVSAPCTAQEPCQGTIYPCPPCCPSPMVCYQDPAGYERIGVDFNLNQQMPATAPCCPQPVLSNAACPMCPASCCPPMQARYTVPFQVPTGPAPKTYEVQLRLHPAAEEACLCPKVCLIEGGDALVSVNCLDKAGKSFCRTMHVQLGKAEGECVPVHFSVTGADAGKPDEKLEVQQAVHFDTVTGLVLSGNGPEPCVAEVVVSPLKKRVTVPEPLTLPNPVATASCGTFPRVQPPLPPPMPIASSPPRPVEPMYWRAPVEPAPVSYFPYPPPGYVPAMPMPQPGYMPYPPVMLTSVPAPMAPPSLPPLDAKVYQVHHTSHFSIVHEAGKARLQMMKDGVCSTSVRMKLETDEVGCLRFAAGSHHVHLAGKLWKASADSVELYDDGRMILAGHVKVVSDKVGVCASLRADRVCLRVKHGKVEKIAGGVFTK